jgi:hypothetical protein
LSKRINFLPATAIAGVRSNEFYTMDLKTNFQIVDGADKNDILGRVLSSQDLPAQRAYSNGDLVWLVDQVAAPKK